MRSRWHGAGDWRKRTSSSKRLVRSWSTNQERWLEPEVWRIDGLLALGAGDRRSAEARFYNALLAHVGSVSAPGSFHAATSLARQWRDQGERAEARDLLAPVYGWFIEGFETADLKDAKALLDQLHELETFGASFRWKRKDNRLQLTS